MADTSQLVCGPRGVPGGAVVVVDGRDPGGDGVGPVPRLGSCVGGVDETRGDSDRVRRQCDMTLQYAPTLGNAASLRNRCAESPRNETTRLLWRFVRHGLRDLERGRKPCGPPICSPQVFGLFGSPFG